MDNFKFIFLLFHAIASGFAQTVEYYPETLKEGEPAVISCSDPNKPLGSPQWDYGDNNKQYTSLCDVEEDDGTLEERDDCYGDGGIGNPANFTFTIRSVQWNRDVGKKWKCLMYTSRKELYIQPDKVNVLVTSVEYNSESNIKRKAETEVKAVTSCHYPMEREIIWCIKRSDEEEIKCSDTDDDENPYYKDIFEDVTIGPVTNTTCDEYEGGLVQKVSSTFRGTTAKNRMNNVYANLFVKVQGSYYKANTLNVDLSSYTGGEIAGIAVGCTAATASVTACIVIIIMKKKKRKYANKHETANSDQSTSNDSTKAKNGTDVMVGKKPEAESQ